jgi:ribonuclease T
VRQDDRVHIARPETFISIDVETAGPNPTEYSLLSIGACVVDDPDTAFYVELKPVSEAVDAEAIAVSGLSIERLRTEGVDPAEAMRRFDEWIAHATPPGRTPVFTAFNAPFDWMFVDTYFRRFIGRNPFGHSALDIKAYHMGLVGSSWADTSMSALSPLYLDGRDLSHNALGDARDQAEMFRRMRGTARRGSD